MKTHHVKTQPRYFIPHLNGVLSFLVVEDNHRWVLGDIIVLQEEFSFAGGLTGRKIELEITYIMDDMVGLSRGFAILGTKILDGQ